MLFSSRFSSPNVCFIFFKEVMKSLASKAAFTPAIFIKPAKRFTKSCGSWRRYGEQSQFSSKATFSVKTNSPSQRINFFPPKSHPTSSSVMPLLQRASSRYLYTAEQTSFKQSISEGSRFCVLADAAMLSCILTWSNVACFLSNCRNVWTMVGKCKSSTGSVQQTIFCNLFGKVSVGDMNTLLFLK